MADPPISVDAKHQGMGLGDIPVFNNSGEEIPGGACVKVTGVFNGDGFLIVEKPDSDDYHNVLVAAEIPIPDQAPGMAWNDGQIHPYIYDGAAPDPDDDDENRIGSQSGSWYWKKSAGGRVQVRAISGGIAFAFPFRTRVTPGRGTQCEDCTPPSSTPAAIEIVVSGVDAAICPCMADFFGNNYSVRVTDLSIDGTYCVPQGSPFAPGSSCHYFLGGAIAPPNTVGSWAYDYYSNRLCHTPPAGQDSGKFEISIIRNGPPHNLWSVNIRAHQLAWSAFSGRSGVSPTCLSSWAAIPHLPLPCRFTWNPMGGGSVDSLRLANGGTVSIVPDGCTP